MKRAEITYLYHSGFCVSTERHLLIFDYIKDPTSTLEQVLKSSQDKQVIVFVSHSHGDHFSPAIFEWCKQHAQIHYVLSHDIKSKHKSHKTIVHPGKVYHVGDVEVEAIESTDIGVAFVVHCDGLVIYHAGDLNWWHWEGEPDEDNAAMALAYKKQIQSLAGRIIDIAFIPVDPRLEAEYHLGLTYFMEAIGANVVFPMHFGQDYTIFELLMRDLPWRMREKIAVITPSQYHFTY